MESLGISMTASGCATSILSELGYDPVYGARPLRRVIQSKVEDMFAEKMLEGLIGEGDKLSLIGADGKIEMTKLGESA